MKKYYAIINAFKFTNKEWWTTYSLEWILQSKYPVKWSKKIYFDKADFDQSFWGIYDESKSNLWLSWLYLEAIELMEVVKEMRVWYWRKNYTVKGVELKIESNWEKKYELYCLLETDYSVAALRKISLTLDQFSALFSDVNTEDKCYWLKDKIIEVVESYKIVETIPEEK